MLKIAAVSLTPFGAWARYAIERQWESHRENEPIVPTNHHKDGTMIHMLQGAVRSIAFAACVTFLLPAYSHGDAKHGKRAAKAVSSEEKDFGREADPKNAMRTVRIDMSDRMRFSPASLDIRRGDTVKFVVKNSGKVMHEMVIGTIRELKEHAEVMKKHPTMEHDEPYMAHVAPGKTETMVWQFTKAGEFHFGCLVPGHFEAGMIGKINVK